MTWNETELHELIEKDDHHLIKKLYLPPNPTEDSFFWSYTPSGIYSVKSGYRLAHGASSVLPVRPPLATHSALSKGIWNLDIVPKLKHFLWRSASSALPVKANLYHRHVPLDPQCPHGCAEIETTDHLLFTLILSTKHVTLFPTEVTADD